MKLLLISLLIRYLICIIYMWVKVCVYLFIFFLYNKLILIYKNLNLQYMAKKIESSIKYNNCKSNEKEY